MHATTHVTDKAGGGDAAKRWRATEAASRVAPPVPVYSGIWPLAHCSQAARSTRRIAAATLDRWQVAAERVDTVLLADSELAANVVEHARLPITMHLSHQQADRHV